MSSESRSLQSVLDAAGDAEQLSLAYASVGDDGCHAVARYVRDNASLQSLDLRGNNTRANGLVVLAHGLKNSLSLASLCLKWNNVGMNASSEVCTRGVRALTDVLIEPSCTLEHLDLRNNNLQPACASHLAEMLGQNLSLRSIDLSWNELGEHSGLLLLEALTGNSTLLDCQLSGNKFSDDTLSNIAAILRTNRRSLEKPRPSAPSPCSPVSPRRPVFFPFFPSPHSHDPSAPPLSTPGARLT